MEKEFIKNLPDNIYEKVKIICEKFFELEESAQNDFNSIEYYEDYLDFYSLLMAVKEADQLEFGVPNITDNQTHTMDLISTVFHNLHKNTSHIVHLSKLDTNKNEYLKLLGKKFMYEFTDGDKNRVQELINELRDVIQKDVNFERNHKERILKRLEILQSELHKKISDMDKFWGLVGDAGVVIGKFGEDAKPIVDRIREITEIVWRTQSRAEELPSDVEFPKLLGKKKE